MSLNYFLILDHIFEFPLYFRVAKLYTQQDGKVKFHPKSVNSEQGNFKSQFLIYHTKVEDELMT